MNPIISLKYISLSQKELNLIQENYKEKLIQVGKGQVFVQPEVGYV